MRDIKRLANKFRFAIEEAKNKGEFVGDQMFQKFPYGCCGITSELLARFLLDNGLKIKLTYVYGTYRNYLVEPQSHAWLKTENDTVIDITADQFRFHPEPLRFNEKVYIGPYNAFYNQFEIDGEEICNNYYSLNDTYILNCFSRKKLYEIILDNIK